MCRRSGYPPSHWSAACFSSIGHLLLPLWLGLGHTDPSQGPNHFPRLIVLSRVELRQQLIRRRRYYQERSPLPAIRVSHYLTIPAPHQGGDRARSIDQPLATVCGNRGEMGMCDPFLIKYYGTGVATSVHTPLNSVTTHDRFGLVRPIVTIAGQQYELDIRFRMLQPHELALAQGFLPTYRFAGPKTQIVRQIGNAVPRRLARAIMAAALTQDPNAPQALLAWENQRITTKAA